MWLNCVFGGVGVGLINMLIYLIVGRVPRRADGRPDAGVPGQEGRGPRDEAGDAGPADPPAADPRPDRAVRGRSTGASRRDEQPRRRTASARSSTSSPRRPRTTAPASRGWATPTGSTTRTRTPAPRRRTPALGHRQRAGDADRPVHPDHRPDRARRRAWRRRSRRRSPPARCGPTRSRSASCCWGRSCWSGRCCSCRPRCSGRWPSTSARCRSGGDDARLVSRDVACHDRPLITQR